MKKKIMSLFLVMVLFASMMTGCIKVVKTGEEGKLTGETKFNPGDDVSKFWESEAIPELEKKAIDINTFIKESNGDFKSLAKKYGKYSMGTSGELNYVVKGTGTVTEVNTSSMAGFMTVKLNDYTGNVKIMLQIGSVITGSSVRDSLSFIKYGDYTNQQEFAAISQSINSLIQKKVVSPKTAADYKGKEISFVGCFTASDNSQMLITPVMIKE
ncbi:MAG: DUF2291 domain-containing protein [Lachnospiraceae bacterium]|jgi:predicted lipoprotein|nr:DUF2291 domain-containing protein [Lachnospiraceae bacterium]